MPKRRVAIEHGFDHVVDACAKQPGVLVHLEPCRGSLETFSRSLRALLGNRYGALHDAIDEVQANFRLGPAFDGIVERMGEFLHRKSPVSLAQGVEARIGERLAIENHGDRTSVYVVPRIRSCRQ